jgi:hypothetical protein
MKVEPSIPQGGSVETKDAVEPEQADVSFDVSAAA